MARGVEIDTRGFGDSRTSDVGYALGSWPGVGSGPMDAANPQIVSPATAARESTQRRRCPGRTVRAGATISRGRGARWMVQLEPSHQRRESGWSGSGYHPAALVTRLSPSVTCVGLATRPRVCGLPRWMSGSSGTTLGPHLPSRSLSSWRFGLLPCRRTGCASTTGPCASADTVGRPLGALSVVALPPAR